MPTSSRLPKRANPRLEERYREARKLILNEIISSAPPRREINISDAYELSKRALDGYVTLDWQHRLNIRAVMQEIRVYAKDRTRIRPLNIIMEAEPGSGKSHLVKCIAQYLKGIRAAAVDFNMATLSNPEDLIQPLDAVRNFKVVDSLPILFLDEFDSYREKYPLLLPLMWDGELNVGHRSLKVGKVVIILAGSGKNIRQAMKAAKAMKVFTPVGGSKLVDLLSRINGGELTIPSLDLVDGERDRRLDKVCLTISLLHNRFGESIELVPWCLLRFVADNPFRYGARSIAHLIDRIQPVEEDKIEINAENLLLPLDNIKKLKSSTLAYHVYSKNGPASIIRKWENVKNCEILVRVKEKPEEEDMS